MIIKLKKIAVLTSVLSVMACGGGGDDIDEQPIVESPEAAILISPLKNAECNQGNIVSETKSNVDFEWNASKNTSTYTVVLTNLDSNQATESSTSGTQLTMTLLRGVAYSWKVISKASGTSATATSETWKLFNAGLPVENYAPFPADAVSPTIGGISSSNASLEWVGSDADGDIESYDVYLSTTNPPSTLIQNTTSTKIDNLTLNVDEVYYWKIITKDSYGNSSESQIFDFRTQ